MTLKKLNQIMMQLPEKFTLKQMRLIIMFNAGLEERTIKKYITRLRELGYIKPTKTNQFEKVKR